MARPGTNAWRLEAWGPPCASDKLTTIAWLPGIRLTVDRRAVGAFLALSRVFLRHGYKVRPEDTGSYNCRRVTGGRTMSSHAWGIAVDVNWSTNPYGRKLVTDMPPAMVEEIKAIRTTGGKPVWRWGGDFPRSKDAMHFELIATPQQLAEDVVQDQPTPTLRRGDTGHAVARLQRILGVQGPAIFGPKTDEAVRSFQTQHGMVVDGIVGPATWRVLLDHERGKGA